MTAVDPLLSPPSLPNLPASILHEICDYLLLPKRQQVWGLCSDLKHFGQEYNGKIKELTLEQEFQFQSHRHDNNNNNNNTLLYTKTVLDHLGNPHGIALLNSFASLEILDLGPNATHMYLSVLASDSISLPSLKKIAMARSLDITDLGLFFLSQGKQLAISLEEIDITFCHQTTYKGTACLREKMINLKVLRRQPAWMDGKFETPFSNSNSSNQVEIHTYWPDGSFQFSRDEQSSGFVCELKDVVTAARHSSDDDGDDADHNVTVVKDGRYVCDKLQYNNFVPPDGWPDWSRKVYRPGVTLLQLDDDELMERSDCSNSSGGEVIRSVLVAQHTRGLRPPTPHRYQMDELAKKEQRIPLGESRYYTHSSNDTGGGESTVLTLLQPDMVEEARRTKNLTMISRMRMIPFDPQIESLMPPKDLVRKNMEIDDGIDTGKQYLEDILHLQLGGDPHVTNNNDGLMTVD